MEQLCEDNCSIQDWLEDYVGELGHVKKQILHNLHDKTIYMEHGLWEKIPSGKKIIVDGVYSSKAKPDNHNKLALSNPMDDATTAKFKARAKACHETFNGPIQFFKALQEKYCHRHSYHKYVCKSIAVMVQYQMDLGLLLFSVWSQKKR